MHALLTGSQIMGYQILGRVKEERDWEEYRAVKEGVTGRLLRTLLVAYYPPQEEYHQYLESGHVQAQEAQEYFAACLQEILDKLSKLEALSEAEENHLLPIYESDVDWDSQRMQYMIYIIKEEALCLTEWENNQDITVEMLLRMGEQMLKAEDVYKGRERFHIGDIYMLTNNEFCLGNLERYVIFKTENREENPLISVYQSYIHIFYETSEEMWEQRTEEEKRTIEILCFLYYYLQGKNMEAHAGKLAEGIVQENEGTCEQASKQMWELLVFCTQNQTAPAKIAERITCVLKSMDDKEREKICVSQRLSDYNRKDNDETIEGFTKNFKERIGKKLGKYGKWALAGTAFLLMAGICFLIHPSKEKMGLKEMNTTNITNTTRETVMEDNIESNHAIQTARAEEYTTQNSMVQSQKEEEHTEKSTMQSKKEEKITEKSTMKTQKKEKITEKSTMQSKKEEITTKQRETKAASSLQTNRSENQTANRNEGKNQNETEREGWDIQWE